MSDLVAAMGWRVVWLPDLNDDVFIIDECRAVLVDVTVSQERLEGLLLEDFASGNQ